MFLEKCHGSQRSKLTNKLLILKLLILSVSGRFSNMVLLGISPFENLLKISWYLPDEIRILGKKTNFKVIGCMLSFFFWVIEMFIGFTKG